MPELPDVESFKVHFEKTSLNKAVEKVDVLTPKMLVGINSEDLNKKIKGKKFSSAGRLGKYLFAHFDNSTLVFHFGMTGYFKYFDNEEDAPGHIRLLFHFEDGGNLAYDNMRKFGSINYVENLEKFKKQKRLGIDAMDKQLTYKKFLELISGKKGNAKAILMDQSLIAGIGNIYSDEILFHTGIKPSNPFSKYKEEKLKEVYNAMKKILKTSIKLEISGKDFPEEYLRNYRKGGKECLICHGTIKHQVVAGRSCYYCTKHQR